MPDSQSSEPRFESPIATVSKIGHFRSLHWCPCWLSCINEYLAIDSGGHVSDLVIACNCCLTRILPREAELVVEWTGLPGGGAKSVKRFERSNGLDTALYKNYLYLFFYIKNTKHWRNEYLEEKKKTKETLVEHTSKQQRPQMDLCISVSGGRRRIQHIATIDYLFLLFIVLPVLFPVYVSTQQYSESCGTFNTFVRLHQHFCCILTDLIIVLC